MTEADIRAEWRRSLGFDERHADDLMADDTATSIRELELVIASAS